MREKESTLKELQEELARKALTKVLLFLNDLNPETGDPDPPNIRLQKVQICCGLTAIASDTCRLLKSTKETASK